MITSRKVLSGGLGTGNGIGLDVLRLGAAADILKSEKKTLLLYTDILSARTSALILYFK